MTKVWCLECAALVEPIRAEDAKETYDYCPECMDEELTPEIPPKWDVAGYLYEPGDEGPTCYVCKNGADWATAWSGVFACDNDKCLAQVMREMCDAVTIQEYNPDTGEWE